MHSRPERANGHIGTETRPKLLREAAVGNFKLCCERKTTRIGNDPWVMVSRQKVTANYVPAAAVIRRWRALSGMIGRKGCVGGPLSLESKPAAQLSYALETGGLECRRGRWNSMCSGKMRRYMEEHQWRRRSPGLQLTLKHESVGSK